MKNSTLCIAWLAILCSCMKPKVENEQFNFVVTGAVTGGEGEDLALWIQSTNLDERLISKVVNGKFEFKGKLNHPERALLIFEREFREYDGSRANYHLFLNKDTVKISANLITDTDNPRLQNDSVLSSEINRHYKTNIRKLYSAFEGVLFKTMDTLYMDSLSRNVLPQRRAKTLQLYEQYFSDKKYPLLSIAALRIILDRNMFFPLEELTKEEKTEITNHFLKIDTSVSRASDYKVTALLVEQMNSGSSHTVFKDFVLSNIGGTTTKLSDIIRKNKITVIDFWWFGCGPCRKFNTETRAKYAMLKENGIEIIGINTDPGMNQWKKATQMDSIPWVNLYAGEKAPIEFAYKVSYAPFKVVVDSDFKILDVKTENITDLIPLAQAASSN